MGCDVHQGSGCEQGDITSSALSSLLPQPCCALPQQPQTSKLTMTNLSRTVIKQGNYIEDLMNETNEIILIGKYGILPKHMKKL